MHFVLSLKCRAIRKTLSSCVATFLYGCNVCLATGDVNANCRDENDSLLFREQENVLEIKHLLFARRNISLFRFYSISYVYKNMKLQDSIAFLYLNHRKLIRNVN